ncbi:hypothetical protein OG948_60550 (plasmid) [Embleya sp. NBC_00888]|uniref:hypothetical protein n=1 Tax=Embleya sp. NBC_00888 TaxID=2975960 RepID=UPI00386A6987|nr:hypothetical protein OG948_60550 [Embleya sp. NBC_00888]
MSKNVATPPSLWGWQQEWATLGVIPSPSPRIERIGWMVRMTGVRFAHLGHCDGQECRKAMYTSTEGGVVELGFRPSGRSFQRDDALARPNFCGTCPNCGHRPGRDDQWVASPCGAGHPVSDVNECIREQWEVLREELGVSTPNMTRADLLRLDADGRDPQGSKRARRRVEPLL